MKFVLAIIQPTKLSSVRAALMQIGVHRVTVCDAQGYGRQRGQPASYRGIEYKVSMLRKLAVEVWVHSELLDEVIDAITLAARSGSAGAIGDGKVFVLPTEQAFLASGQSDPEAG